MVVVNKSAYWKSFFQMYRSMPELWQSSSVEYKSKDLKLESWKRLLKKYNEFDPNATLSTLKNKIHNIRSSFARECRRIKKGLQSGTPYTPNLWYYYELSFLRKQDDQIQSQEWYYDTDSADSDGTHFGYCGDAKRKKPNSEIHVKMEDDNTSNLDNGKSVSASIPRVSLDHSYSYDDGGEPINNTAKHETNHLCSNGYRNSENNDDEEEETQSRNYGESGSAIKLIRPNDKHELKETDDPLNINTSFLRTIYGPQERRDEASVYAEGWATSYRKLSKTQKIMARKAIEEIFFLGEMEQLTPGVVRMPRL